jgi:O-antigen/teichoic acid export membrane protein
VAGGPPSHGVPDDDRPQSGSPPTASARGLLSSYGLLALSSLGGQTLGFIGLAVVARRLGPHYLGAYGFANNLSNYFALPLMAGVAMVGIREIAVSADSRMQTVLEVQGFLLLNGVIAYVVLVALAPILSSDPLSRTLLPLAGLPLIINAAGLGWAMQGMQRFRPLALYRFLGQVVYLVVLLAVLTGGATGAERYALCNALGFGVTAMLSTIYVWRSLSVSVRGILEPARHFVGRLRKLVRRSLAPSISLVMIQVYYSLDFVLLGYLRGDHAVGEYTTASRIPMGILVLASLWVTVFYPHAATLFHSDKERLRRQVGQFMTLSALAAFPLVPFGFVMGHQIMAAMFGQAYGPSGTAFAILLSSSAVALLNANIGQILLACGDDKAFLLSVTVGAVLNVALNVALIPQLGIAGSALATLLAEAAVIVSVSIRFWHTMGRITLEWSRLARASLALLGAFGLLLLLRPISPWWSALFAGILGYAVLLIAVRAISFAEIRHILRPRSSTL